ncbi:NYN domain-containing protein [Halotia branconii]|uniref:NYN domain-containing protein n=1 Tax=Halotia branconii CENA392 TaxID=1539056 RepID=A0AAJ6NP99_9CYAN|nr:NYN domain-containing protein [Halotia branconii]WGV23898.1 NYN domain-containing protein [Halotia branconii CENA392]
MTINTFPKTKNAYKRLEEETNLQGKILIRNGIKSEDPKKNEPKAENLIINDLNRGRVAIFIDGVNLFHAALQLGIEIDYLKLLCRLTAGSRLLRAFFYTTIDVSRQTTMRPRSNEKQQGFLFWMRRNGYRVFTKEVQSVDNSKDNSKKSNLNVEIAVDMITLAPHYDTAILVSGDGDLAYAVNAVTSTGSRVELVSLRTMTSDSLIDVADYFVDLDSIKQYIQKDSHPGYNYRAMSNSKL